MKKILVLFGLGVILTGCEKQAQETVLDELLAQKEVEKVYSNELIEKEVVNNNKESNEFDDWEIYTNEEITFKYPKGWFIRKDVKYNTIYISNKEWKDYSAGEYPEDFLGAWISYRKPSTGTSSYQEELELFNKPNMTEIISTNSMKINMREFSYNPKSERSGGGPYLNALWEKNSWIFSASTKDSDNKENNEMVVEIFKQILSTVEESDELGELKVYKNEKYGYSFKYPKDWYIYENLDFSECRDKEIVNTPDVVFLSKEKKDLCEVGFGVMGSSLGSDVYISVHNGENDNFSYLYNTKKEDWYHDLQISTKEYNIGDINGYMYRYMYSTEVNEVFLRNFAKIYIRKNGYDYEIGVRQLDSEGKLDPELMKVVDSFVIEK